MGNTFFFYDLETTGIDPRSARVMQFAGQRTGMDLQPIGEPVDVLIKLTADVVPEPDAIMITGITPQKTLTEGISEAEFLRLFTEQVATPGTIFVGFNTVRFDDEFMRFMHYRNFYDPYEWQWQDGRSRWDLLDLVRMTRALRPEGITWPFAPDGSPSNRLELLTSVNGIAHENAHDALADVRASIALAQLLHDKQPKLFTFMLGLRSKKAVVELVGKGDPFIYSSGQYESQYEKTTVVSVLAAHPKQQTVFVYDLRYNPAQYKDHTAEQLVELWRWKRDAKEPRLPVKALQFNKCPAIAPLSALLPADQARLQLDPKIINTHLATLGAMPEFSQKLLKAFEILDKQCQTSFLAEPKVVDAQLYDGFFDDGDRTLERALRAADPAEIAEFADQFSDARLQALVPLYKARNYPDQLNDDERAAWDAHCQQTLFDGDQKSRLARYFARLGELAESDRATPEQQYLLEELQLYGQSLLP